MSASTHGRDVYANLLRESRRLGPTRAQARAAWYAALSWENKEKTLFELEALLKGIARFAEPRHHPRRRRGGGEGPRDLALELRTVRDGLTRIGSLVRSLLGSVDAVGERPPSHAREPVGKRLAETALQRTPEEALLALREMLVTHIDLIDGALATGAEVSKRVHAALLTTLTRAIERNAFFDPLFELEFSVELDRIRHAEVLEALHGVDDPAAHRLLALSMLTLLRANRYLDLLSTDGGRGRTGRRAYLLLAALHGDLEAMTRHVRERAADTLTHSLERSLLSVPAAQIRLHRARLEEDIARFAELQSALRAVVHELTADLEAVFEATLPAPEVRAGDEALAEAVSTAAAALQASLRHAITSLCRAVAPGRAGPQLALDDACRTVDGERLRRSIWTFTLVVRAFVAKARALDDPGVNRWETPDRLAFVGDFLRHVRAVGHAVVKENDYERLEPWLDALRAIQDVDLIDPSDLERAVAECAQLETFLGDLFESVSRRSALRGHAFDRPFAAETLRAYIAR